MLKLFRTDLVGEADLLKVEAEIRHINKTAAIRKSFGSLRLKIGDMFFFLGTVAGTSTCSGVYARQNRGGN